nr:MAG TPA: hypothetical protein [Caudoviricetes sp.]
MPQVTGLMLMMQMKKKLKTLHRNMKMLFMN